MLWHLYYQSWLEEVRFWWVLGPCCLTKTGVERRGRESLTQDKVVAGMVRGVERQKQSIGDQEAVTACETEKGDGPKRHSDFVEEGIKLCKAKDGVGGAVLGSQRRM